MGSDPREKRGRGLGKATQIRIAADVVFRNGFEPSVRPLRPVSANRAGIDTAKGHVANAAQIAFLVATGLPRRSEGDVMGKFGSRSPRSASALLAAFAAAALAHAPAGQAAIFKVGTGSQLCDFATIDAAVAAAEANPGPDTIRLTRTLSYAGRHIVINTAQDLEIVGGFATCTTSLPDTSKTVIDMETGGNFSVIRITGAAVDATVRLRNLRLTGGTATNGGGIYYLGAGTLEMSQMEIDNNEASNGGGIYFQGNSDSAKLIIGESTRINSNIANATGGGVFLRKAEMTMTEPGSSIIYNRAVRGGGIRLYGADGSIGTKAVVGSNGYAGFATIGYNEATFGGGVSVQGQEGGSRGTADFALVAGADISENFASQRGGGIDLQNYNDVLGNYGFASAFLGDGILQANAAPQAAAIYVGYDVDAAGFSAGSFLAVLGGAFIGNRTVDGSNVQTNGGVIVLAESAGARLYRATFQDNVAGSILRGDRSDEFNISDSLISNNTLQRSAIEVLNSGSMDISGSTITNNALSGNVVIAVANNLELKQSIVWQPGKQTAQIGGARDIDDVIASELASLVNSPSVISRNPRFVDPGHDDYHLQPASPAVDFAGVIGDIGLDGQQHNKDMALVANFFGIGDLGAYELQGIGNLVLDPEFTVDLRLWNVVTAGVSSWISAGASAAGSVTIAKTPVASGDLIGLSQCVHIPGPGLYQLSGFTHGGAEINNVFRDSANIGWALRYNTGNESCAGPTNGTGVVVFPKSATFVAPTAPAIINVPASAWTPYTSVEVSLIVREGDVNPNGTTSGSFDGIVLQAIASDRIFANGFEP